MSAPRVALLTISDRPDLLEATLESLAAALDRDAGDLLGAFTGHVHVDDRDHRLGFAGAIREGWRRLRELSWAEVPAYVLHVEDDWRFDQRVPLARMAELLDWRPNVAQVALLRGPVNDTERAAGGLVEQWPREYRQGYLADPFAGDLNPLPYLEHGLYFTTNPSLYRMSLVNAHDWPTGAGSERRFTERLLNAGYRFACLGNGDPWVTHTGDDRREGKGY